MNSSIVQAARTIACRPGQSSGRRSMTSSAVLRWVYDRGIEIPTRPVDLGCGGR
jgi:hypothetical protein